MGEKRGRADEQATDEDIKENLACGQKRKSVTLSGKCGKCGNRCRILLAETGKSGHWASARA